MTRARAFTLAELMVVMGIIAVLAVITVISVANISKGARLATATNTVTSTLENARGLAMKTNRLTMVAFRARATDKSQVVEAVTARWTGDTYRVWTGTTWVVVDRFEPIPDVPHRDLPRGVKVAAPFFTDDGQVDAAWMTSTDLPAVSSGEAPGVIAAVMYGADGTRVYSNRASTAQLGFVDFNSDGLQRQDGEDFTNRGLPWIDNTTYSLIGATGLTGMQVDKRYFGQRYSDDEPYVLMAPFMSVFDDEAAREYAGGTSGWSDALQRTAELSEFIRERADRIHFNRYTGVVMR